MPSISRRDVLKLLGAAAPLLLFPKLISQAAKQEEDARSNVIVLLFDAMSARNLSLYGYPRPTTPNLERFAQHANVYHAHHASGNFTIPGTASLLTGTYPWTHRAINSSGAIKRSMLGNNIFRAFGAQYHRLAYPQNTWANIIVTQFQQDVDTLISSGAFSELNFLLGDHFVKDRNMATRALDDFVFNTYDKTPSMILGPLERALLFQQSSRLSAQGYPRGIPYNGNYPIYFRLEELFYGLALLIPSLPAPSFAYLHLFPPHAPYRASDRFDSKFIDDYVPLNKPIHRLSGNNSNTKLKSARRSYDEYVASLDFEFGRLLDALEESGVFENSYVLITSDHGEMFERGENAHVTPLLYEPVTHVPLLVSSPGQTSRRDVYAPTNAVDVFPTLMKLTGQPVPAWCEGQPLPGLGGVEDFERSTFTVEAKQNSSFASLTKATFAMRKANLKLIYYTGYENEDSFELYDMDADGEELKDLYPSLPTAGKRMKEELLETVFQVNAPYAGKK